MTVNHQSKAAMHAVKSLSDPLGSQGARRATEDASGSAPPVAGSDISAEVVPHARRRQFSNADKRRILDAADRCTRPGEVGALMRREGVYSSSLSTWRRQRETADLAALAGGCTAPQAQGAAGGTGAQARGELLHGGPHGLSPLSSLSVPSSAASFF